MTAASDIVYGRHGGRIVAPATPSPGAVPSRAEPTTATIAAHLLAEHLTTGITSESVIGTDPLELLRWHDVDHRLVNPTLLGHIHSATLTAEPELGHDDKVHAANLKAIAEGRQVANLDEMCKRAAVVAARQLRAETARAAGHRPAPGDAVTSPYDRRCLEIAQAVAARAARRAARRGTHAA